MLNGDDGLDLTGAPGGGGPRVLSLLRSGPAPMPANDPAAVVSRQYQLHLNVERIRVPEVRHGFLYAACGGAPGLLTGGAAQRATGRPRCSCTTAR